MSTYSDHQQRMLDQGRDIEEVRQHRPRVTQPEAEGRRAYEADVQERPLYHDGTPRKSWDQLGDVERWSWARKSS